VKLQVRKQMLKARVRELESQVSEAEEESREARAKYISLGLKVRTEQCSRLNINQFRMRHS
jgi:hypothetical protein